MSPMKNFLVVFVFVLFSGGGCVRAVGKWKQVSIEEKAKSTPIVFHGLAIETLPIDAHPDLYAVQFWLINVYKGADAVGKYLNLDPGSGGVFNLRDRKINVTGFSYNSKCHSTVAPQKYYIIFCELGENELVAKLDVLFGAIADWSEKNEKRVWRGVGWENWSDWGTCSTSCGEGFQERSRKCVLGEKSCHGYNKERRRCNMFSCQDILTPGMHLCRFSPTVDSVLPIEIFNSLGLTITSDICVHFPNYKIDREGMANKLENIIQQALKTFRKPVKRMAECSQSDLNELKTLADEVVVNDVQKLESLLKNVELKDFLQLKKTSLDYLSVYEDENISVGVFLLKQDAKLPIHDHPEMHGIIKVLEGILRVTSYTVVELDKSTLPKDEPMYYQHPLKVIKHPEVVVGKADQSLLLSPSEKNIHEVECIEGPAAFLDILSPPYEEGEPSAPRSCHFFKEVPPDRQSSSKQEDKYLKLLQIPSPF